MSTTSHEGLGALSGSFLGLSCIVVALRFYARNVQKASLKMDDWVMLLGLVSTGEAMGQQWKYGLATIESQLTSGNRLDYIRRLNSDRIHRGVRV